MDNAMKCRMCGTEADAWGKCPECGYENGDSGTGLKFPNKSAVTSYLLGFSSLISGFLFVIFNLLVFAGIITPYFIVWILFSFFGISLSISAIVFGTIGLKHARKGPLAKKKDVWRAWAGIIMGLVVSGAWGALLTLTLTAYIILFHKL